MWLLRAPADAVTHTYAYLVANSPVASGAAHRDTDTDTQGPDPHAYAAANPGTGQASMGSSRPPSKRT